MAEPLTAIKLVAVNKLRLSALLAKHAKKQLEL